MNYNEAIGNLVTASGILEWNGRTKETIPYLNAASRNIEKAIEILENQAKARRISINFP